MHILFTGGGTLGPVTPLIAVKDAIKAAEPAAEFSWIGTASGPEEALVRAAGIAFHSVPAGKLRRYLDLRNFTDHFRVLAGFARSLRLLRRLRPDVVVSAGGFVAVPVIWAAALLRIKVHVHQQDARPGLANRLTAVFAHTMSVAFEKSLADFKRHSPVWTGNPVRPELRNGSRGEAAKFFGLDVGLPTVLVIGGGTGSASLNALTLGALPRLLASAQVIHGTGRAKSAAAEHPRYRGYELLKEEMRHAYALADVVAARAGMGTLSEISGLGKAAVLVPIAASHQEDNADIYCAAGAAVCLDELEINAGQFADAVLALLADPQKRRVLAEAAEKIMPAGADRRIAEIILHSAKS